MCCSTSLLPALTSSLWTSYSHADMAHSHLSLSSDSPFDLVGLGSLMQLTSGDPRIGVCMIDGPVALDHPLLDTRHVRILKSKNNSMAASAEADTHHGTATAGILFAKRNSAVPGICPECTIGIRPILQEMSASTAELAEAILDGINSGSRIINMSLALSHLSLNRERGLEDALQKAAAKGVLVVAAAGNGGAVAGSVITRHPAVIPVVGCDSSGRPTRSTNLGLTIGRRGVCAPGEGVLSLSSRGGTKRFAGTSVASAIVTGAVALLWSLLPHATAAQVRTAILRSPKGRRLAIVPQLLDSETAFAELREDVQ
jgi:subtilisin family serine protease